MNQTGARFTHKKEMEMHDVIREADKLANQALLDETTYQAVLAAIQEVGNLDGLTSFLLKYDYYLTKAAPSVNSQREWRGLQETYGREEE